MAHFQQQQFVASVRDQFPRFFEGRKVLEVGSWDVNGTVRDHFQACEYIGTDVAPGRGVDLVAAGQDIDLPSNSFDVVISCECLEHNPFWIETFLNMARMLKPGGLFVMTCAGLGRGEHGTARTDPMVSLSAREGKSDYYRNLCRRDFDERIDLEIHFSHYVFFDNRYSKDLYFLGIKRQEVPDAEIAEKLDSLGRAVRRINKQRRLTLTQAIGAQSEWWLKWSAARLLGEKRYHDVRHRVRPRYRQRRCEPDPSAPSS